MRHSYPHQGPTNNHYSSKAAWTIKLQLIGRPEDKEALELFTTPIEVDSGKWMKWQWILANSITPGTRYIVGGHAIAAGGAPMEWKQ
ncbi:unnamed protein product, partial [Iphiclides podalirius]